MAEDKETEKSRERAPREAPERHSNERRPERQTAPSSFDAGEREKQARFRQRKEAEARDVVKVAQSLERARRQIKILREKMALIDDRESNQAKVAEINQQIAIEEGNAGRCRQAIEREYLGFETEIKGFEDLGVLISSDQYKGEQLEALKILRDVWIEAGVAKLKANREGIINKIDLLASRRRDAIRERLGLMKQNPMYSYQVAAQVLGDPSFDREVYELVKDLPEEEARYLVAYSRKEVESSSAFVEMQKSLSLDWGEKTEAEQEDYIRQRIRNIRNSMVDPSMILNSPGWIDLVQKMNDSRTSFEVIDRFNSHFKLLQYYISGRNLADAIIDPRDFTSKLEVLSSGVVGGLFREKEIQIAYDLLVKNSREVLKINTEGSLWDTINEKYKKEYLRERGVVGKATEDQESEAKAALTEAFDLFYIFNSLQDVESSQMKPDSVRKALNLSAWMKGKFAPELVEAFSKLRFYRLKDGKKVAIKTSVDEKDESEFQRVNAGVNKPLHNLFTDLKEIRNLERLGFTVSRNEATIYDYRDRECFSAHYEKDPQNERWKPEVAKEGPKKGKPEMVKGTYVFTKEHKGRPNEEVEALIKENGDLVVVRVSNITAETLGDVFKLSGLDKGKETSGRLIDQKWLYNYGKFNLIYGENTRQACLKKSLFSDPVGSLDGELKDPLRRLQEADMSGDFLANCGWRYGEEYTEKKGAYYEIMRDDWTELYLDAVLKISKNRQSGKFIDNLNYVSGGENLRSYLIGNARAKGYLTNEGEKRLVDEYFGGDWQRWLKRKIDSMGILFALRYPGMIGMMGREGLEAFWEAFKAYVFEGTGMESIFGGTKPRRQ